MNALEIQKRRKELGLNQSELAKKLGVSVKTISNYENGEVIPISKKALLHEILSNNTLKEEEVLLENGSKNYTVLVEKVKRLQEIIHEHEEICLLLKDDPVEYNHHNELIKLLKTRISIIERSKKTIYRTK